LAAHIPLDPSAAASLWLDLIQAKSSQYALLESFESDCGGIRYVAKLRGTDSDEVLLSPNLHHFAECATEESINRDAREKRRSRRLADQRVSTTESHIEPVLFTG
jgi:hypothetical protein